MERPKLPIYMKFKTRLSESMVGEAKVLVASRRLAGDLCALKCCRFLSG